MHALPTPNDVGSFKNSSTEKSIPEMGRRDKNLRNYIDLSMFH